MFWICVSWEHKVGGEVMPLRRQELNIDFWKNLPGAICQAHAPQIPASAFPAWLVRMFFV